MACFCKACGKVLRNARERRLLSEKPYRILFELVKEIANGQPPAASTTHRILGSNSSYVCIPCFSTLTKFGAISEQLGIIKAFLKSTFNADEPILVHVCLCCSAHTSGCVVDGLGATAAF